MKLLLDMLSRIKLACMSRKSFVKVKYSKFCLMVLDLLLVNGYISSYEIIDNYFILVFIRYSNGLPVFKNIVHVSNCRKSVFVSNRSLIKKIKHSFLVISNKGGVMTRDEAILKGIGGLILFYII